MQGDSEILHRAVTILSYGRSKIHGIANVIEQTIKKAKENNKGKMFDRLTEDIDEAIKKMRDIAEDFTKIGKVVSELEALIGELEGE